MMYEVIILKEGYSISESPGQQRSCGSITLLKGPHTIIVDTGNPWDRDLIVEGLRKNGLSPEKIQYCVCSHGHLDHVGNLSLFSHAIHIVSYDVCTGDQFVHHDFAEGIPYEIDQFVEIVATPGHTGADVSVIVKETAHGTVVVSGDLFECFEDLEDPQIWQNNSERPEQQEQSRIEILRIADYIIPGHGPMFQVPEEYKKQLRVMMVYEEFSLTDIQTSVDYQVWEQE